MLAGVCTASGIPIFASVKDAERLREGEQGPLLTQSTRGSAEAELFPWVVQTQLHSGRGWRPGSAAVLPAVFPAIPQCPLYLPPVPAVSNPLHSHLLSHFRGRRKQNENAFHFLLLLPCTDSSTIVTGSLSEVCGCTPLLPTTPHLGPHCSTSLPSLAPRGFTQEIGNIALSQNKNWQPLVPLRRFPIALLSDEWIFFESPWTFPLFICCHWASGLQTPCCSLRMTLPPLPHPPALASTVLDTLEHSPHSVATRL